MFSLFHSLVQFNHPYAKGIIPNYFQLGQPLSKVMWENGGVKTENAEFKMQSAEGGKFTAAGKDAGPEAGVPMEANVKMEGSRGVGGMLWRKTVVLNYTHLHAFTRFYTMFLSLTLRARAGKGRADRKSQYFRLVPAISGCFAYFAAGCEKGRSASFQQRTNPEIFMNDKLTIVLPVSALNPLPCRPGSANGLLASAGEFCESGGVRFGVGNLLPVWRNGRRTGLKIFKIALSDRFSRLLLTRVSAFIFKAIFNFSLISTHP